MNEVDGRPGHVALQSGHLDALQDVHSLSLCQSIVLSQSSPTPTKFLKIPPKFLKIQGETNP